MRLPAGVQIISPENYDPDGFYEIGAGHTHIFRFRVPAFQNIKVGLSHVRTGTQDWSLDCWFSKKPLDDVLFRDRPDVTHAGVPRLMKVVNFWDSLVYQNENGSSDLYYPSNEFIYINIRNQQNQLNGYRLVFNFDEEKCNSYNRFDI